MASEKTRIILQFMLTIMPCLHVGAVKPDSFDLPNWNNTRDSLLTFLDNDFKGILKGLEDIFYSADSSGNVFDNIHFNCLNDTEKIIVDLTNKESYALQFIDADAKIPSGILQGEIHWPGDFHECIKIQSTYNPYTDHSFKGKYYTANLAKVYVGFCVPDSCNKDDARSLLSAIFNQEEIIHVFSTDRIDANTGDIVGFVVCGLIAITVMVCTALDYILTYRNNLGRTPPKGGVVNGYNVSTQEPTERTGLLVDALLDINPMGPSKMRHVIQAFSFLQNMTKLLSTKTATGPLACLNGLRVISMFWVIQGHTYGFSTMVLKDPLYAENTLNNRFSFQAIDNGTYSVDSFFFLSGLLVAYLALKELSEKGKLSWIYYFAHRYWRLTPIYAVCLMFFTTAFRFLLTGPFVWIGLDPAGPLYSNMNECRKYWWSNLLYINNLYPNYGSESNCMGWAWYLANDMQFYVLLGPIMIILLHKRPRIGISFGVFLLASCIASRAIVADYYQMTQYGQATRHTDEKWVSGGPLYTKPYARWSVYIIGMLVGYILQTTRCNIRVHKILMALGWCVAIATAMAVVWGLNYYNAHPGTVMSRTGSVLYLACARTGWGVALAWLTLACATGQGGWINRILAWRYWAPLGRLTYAAYLVHPMVLTGYYFTIMQPIPFNDMTFVHLFIGNIVLSYGVAFVVSMAIEAPMMQLEKIILNR